MRLPWHGQVLPIATIFCQGSPVFSPVWVLPVQKLDAFPKVAVAEVVQAPQGDAEATTDFRFFDLKKN